MRIAVTGASGRIGGEVVRLLTAQQHQVVALTRRPPGAAPGPAGAEVRQADYQPQEITGSSMFASVRDQRWAAVSADTERLTGRPPTPVRTILARR